MGILEREEDDRYGLLGIADISNPALDGLAGLYNRIHAPPPPEPVAPIWDLNNPVGTQRIGDPEMRTADPGFRPAGFVAGGVWGPERPIAQESKDDISEGSRQLFSELAMLAPGLGGPRVPTPAIAGRVRSIRGGPIGPRRQSAGYTTEGEVPVDEQPPAFGIGHNNAPARSAIWANPQRRWVPTAQMTGGNRGRMGSNADTELENLGLPSYADIVPSTNTGPVSQAMLQGGSPVRPGQVFDLSDTWRVPSVPQTELPSIDPDAGKRRGLPDHVLNATGDPNIKAKMRMVAEAGLEHGGGAYWYNTEPLRMAFVTELGPEEGNAVFEKYMRTIGAVSAGSDVSQNIRTASYYNVRERQGRPVQGVELENGKGWAPTDIEYPYGHKMQNTQYTAYRDIAGGDPLDPEGRPKRARFDANLTGNQRPVTVDKHNMRLIGMLSQDPEFLNTTIKADVNYPEINVAKGDSINFRQAYLDGRLTMDQLLQIPAAWKDVPNANHYGALERFQQELADEMGISPAQLQAALWVGGGRVTGLKSLPTSFMGAFEGRLQKTALERGGTPMKALLDFIRGRAPLLTPVAAAGGAGASGLLSIPDEERR